MFSKKLLVPLVAAIMLLGAQTGIASDEPKHKLVIHGMVKQPLKFTMSDLMRYRAMSVFNFMECSGNTLTDWQQAKATTVQQSHGLLSCAQWTGIPVSWPCRHICRARSASGGRGGETGRARLFPD